MFANLRQHRDESVYLFRRAGWRTKFEREITVGAVLAYAER
jgi:hypothetical protein